MAPDLPPEAKQKVIELVEVITSESEILTLDEINQLSTPYVGRMVSLADLYELVAQFDALYKEKGFSTGKAILPPQRISDGTVRIDLIEARIGKVSFDGAERTSEAYLHWRLPFEIGELVDVNEARPLLMRFNRTNDAQVHLRLAPGEEPGTTDYQFEVQEPPQYALEFSIDNYGQKRSGRERGSLDASVASVLGFRDRFAFGGSVTDPWIAGRGARSVYAAYQLPLNRVGTTIRFAVDRGENKSVVRTPVPSATPAPDATPRPANEIIGDSFSASVTLDHPVHISQTLAVRAFGGLTYRESDLDTVGFSTFGVRFFDAELWVSEAGVAVEHFDSSGVTAMSHSFRYIADQRTTIQGADVRDDDSGFKYVGRIDRSQTLMPGVQLLLRASGQMTPKDNLAASEQFQVGGAFSVRGYPESHAIGDRGYTVSAQVNTLLPPFTAPRPGALLQGFVFADHGGVRIGGGAANSDYLTSVGAGLSVNWRNLVRQEWTVGFPLDDRNETSDAEFHFRVGFSAPVDELLSSLGL